MEEKGKGITEMRQEQVNDEKHVDEAKQKEKTKKEDDKLVTTRKAGESEPQQLKNKVEKLSTCNKQQVDDDRREGNYEEVKKYQNRNMEN